MTPTSELCKELRDDNEPREWLLMKRDLYERPEHMGYTGIRDNAGLFTEEDAKSSVGDGGYGVTMIHISKAPEFTTSCFDDLARDHLQKKIDALRSDLARAADRIEELEAALAEAKTEVLAVYDECEGVAVPAVDNGSIFHQVEAYRSAIRKLKARAARISPVPDGGVGG